MAVLAILAKIYTTKRLLSSVIGLLGLIEFIELLELLGFIELRIKIFDKA